MIMGGVEMGLTGWIGFDRKLVGFLGFFFFEFE